MIYLSLLLVSGIMTHRAHNALLRALRVMVQAEHYGNHERNTHRPGVITRNMVLWGSP
jgi:hypothetical protein